jgi:hypothetical protein
MITGENRALENAQAVSVLRQLAPRVFRSDIKVNEAVAILRKRHDLAPYAGASSMSFSQFVRAYAEYAMNC